MDLFWCISIFVTHPDWIATLIRFLVIDTKTQRQGQLYNGGWQIFAEELSMEGSPHSSQFSRTWKSRGQCQKWASYVLKKTSTFITFIFRKDTFIIHTFISYNITFSYVSFYCLWLVILVFTLPWLKICNWPNVYII